MISTAMMTKRSGFLLMAMGLLAGLAMATMFGGGSAAQAGGHTGFESVRTNVSEVSLENGAGAREKDSVWFRGSGFTPGTAITILVSDSNGVLTDISIPAGAQRDGGSSVWPLTANFDGAWATQWTIGRFARNNVGGEGIFTVLVVDESFSTLATTPLSVCNDDGRAKYAAANPEATTVIFGETVWASRVANYGIAKEVTDVLEANPDAIIEYYTLSLKDEAMDALGDLWSAGKVDVAGSSNFADGAVADAKFILLPDYCSA